MTLRNAAFVGLRVLSLYLIVQFVGTLPQWGFFRASVTGFRGQVTPVAAWISLIGPIIVEIIAIVGLWVFAGKIADLLAGDEKVEFAMTVRDWAATASILIGMFMIVRALPSLLANVGYLFEQPETNGLINTYVRHRPLSGWFTTGLIDGIVMLVLGLVMVLAHNWVAGLLTSVRVVQQEEVGSDG